MPRSRRHTDDAHRHLWDVRGRYGTSTVSLMIDAEAVKHYVGLDRHDAMTP